MGGPGFAVVEFTTTGLNTAGSDRATGISIAQLNPDGHLERQWRTRLRVDGYPAFSGSDPEFADVAPIVVDLLAGRILVAHGASFHLGFLARELGRVALAVPHDAVALCTLQLAHEVAPRVSRSATVCCAELGGGSDRPPTAQSWGDATATVALLATLIGLDDDPAFWQRHLGEAHTTAWPVLTVADAPVLAVSAEADTARTGDGTAQAEVTSGFLARLVPQLPVALGPAEHHDYLALLDLCLLRGWLTERHSLSLVRMAERLNISRFVCESLHLDYFAALCELAHRDAAALTDSRIARLWAVGDLLDLPMSAILDALGQLQRDTTRQLLAG